MEKRLDEKFCTDCGQLINIKAVVCTKCGVPQATLSSNKKSKYVAAVLALFLGGIGAHRFYTGDILWGLLYLFFFWTFIPAILALVEFIIFLCIPQEQFQAMCDKNM